LNYLFFPLENYPYLVKLFRLPADTRPFGVTSSTQNLDQTQVMQTGGGQRNAA
jgi:hypothetical protein